MQNLIVRIPDNKLDFFLELIQNLGFVKIEEEKPISDVLSPEQVKLVEEERQKVKKSPDSLLCWEEARKSLKLD